MDPHYENEEMESNLESMFDHLNHMMTSLQAYPSTSSEVMEENSQYSRSTRQKHACCWSKEGPNGGRGKSMHPASSYQSSIFSSRKSSSQTTRLLRVYLWRHFTQESLTLKLS